MKGCTRVNTTGMSRVEWLERRKKSIGGSDAAAIVGLSNYASPYSVWAEKTGRLPDKPDNEAMLQGRDLEDYVARRWTEETGKRVKRINAMLYHPAYPFAHADVDRWVMGENAGLECKTTSTLDLRQFKGVEFPEKYYAQCVHYMAVTGAARWYLAVLVFGREFMTFTLERDQGEIDALMEAEKEFWGHVERDEPPAMDGTIPTTEATRSIYPQSNEKEIELFGRGSMLHRYFQLKESAEHLAREIDRIENIIRADMGECGVGVCPGYSVRWKTQTRRIFQTAKFAQEHPEMELSTYYKESKSRPFKIMKES